MTIISNGMFLQLYLKKGQEQQKLRINWCKCHKDWNWDFVQGLERKYRQSFLKNIDKVFNKYNLSYEIYICDFALKLAFWFK